MHSSYYWPTIFKDAKKFVHSCDGCQRMGKPIQIDEMPLQPQVLIEPFERWDLDFDGPLTLASKGKSYILVCTDYVTKWIEAKALPRDTEQAVADFLYEDIFTCFGVPREIVTDQGTQFTSKLIQSFMQQFKIKNRFSTPYHPQANGQVESTNKVLEAILTKTVQQNHKEWVDRLLGSLWAYRITWRSATGFSLYEMVYDNKVLLLIEFQIDTFRTVVDLNLELTEAQKQRLAQLNELDEIRQEAFHQTDLVQQ